MARQHTKPFNLDHCRAGAPVGARNERNKIDILKYTEKYIIGTIAYGEEHEVGSSWFHDGNSGVGEGSDLVMLPLGYCEGKPVFTGDMLFDMQCAVVEAATATERIFEQCKWPKPEPKYPKTRLSQVDIIVHVGQLGYEKVEPHSYIGDGLEKAANYGILHAIECGDVFTKQQVTAVLEELRNICLRHTNPLNIRDIVDGTDWDAILKAGM